MEGSPPSRSRWPRAGRPGLWAAAAWGLLAVVWCLDITGRLDLAHSPALSRLAAALALLAVLATLYALGDLLGRALRVGGERRATALALLAVVLFALAARLAGIAHEATGRYYGDEGIYYHHATQIDQGEVFRRSFIYPHLTYDLDAFTLWTAGLFPGAVARLGALLWGLADPLAVSWVLLRLVVALLGALTAVPVFFLGRRLTSPAGLLGGVLGAALLIASPLYNAGSHLNTCDIPAAFFATLCLAAAARLLDGESPGGYALAGLAAGLAAASKYPAGLSALAIVAVWLRWRMARRDLSWGLLWAGLAALAAFLGAMPSLVVYPDAALHGRQSMFFGVHQYGRGGWIGVVKESNGLFYLENLAESFGWPVLLAGIAGLPLLGRERLARLAWLLPFPVLYFALLCAMNMVVKRNLYPALPAFSAFLGAGIAALVAYAWQPHGRRSPLLRASAALVLLACFALPVWATVEQDAGLVMKTTREQAAEWIHQHLPPGTQIVKEDYTPDLSPAEFAVLRNRFAGRFTLDELRDKDNDYLLLAGDAYQRFLNPELTVKPHQRQIGERYRAILDGWKPIAEWAPDDVRLGPILKLYRLTPLPADCLSRQELPAADAFVPDSAMRVGEDRVAFGVAGQWALVKGCFPPGTYTLTVQAAGLPPGSAGEVRAVRLTDGGEVGHFPLQEGKAGPFALAQPGKVLFYLYLPPGATLTGVTVAP